MRKTQTNKYGNTMKKSTSNKRIKKKELKLKKAIKRQKTIENLYTTELDNFKKY